MYFLYLTWLSKNHTIDLCPCPAIFGILSCRLLKRVSASHLMSLVSFLFFLTTDVFFSSGAVCADDRRLKVYYTENTKIIGKNVNIQREVWLCLWPILRLKLLRHTIGSYWRWPQSRQLYSRLGNFTWHLVFWHWTWMTHLRPG